MSSNALHKSARSIIILLYQTFLSEYFNILNEYYEHAVISLIL